MPAMRSGIFWQGELIGNQSKPSIIPSFFHPNVLLNSLSLYTFKQFSEPTGDMKQPAATLPAKTSVDEHLVSQWKLMINRGLV
jgi:hypothetical protein